MKHPKISIVYQKNLMYTSQLGDCILQTHHLETNVYRISFLIHVVRFYISNIVSWQVVNFIVQLRHVYDAATTEDLLVAILRSSAQL